jgi:predicted nucleic acid-binding Zn ribbon protein
MERAAKIIKKNKHSRQVMSDEDIARAVWPAAVGKAIASHTSRLKLVRNKLVIEVEDAIWQRQLHTLSIQIIGRLRTLTGSDAIEELEFRIGVPRREAQRAESLAPGLLALQPDSDDESHRIQDPVLKKVYQLSRKRAIA